ncbi:MAG: SDR family oxidoreductase [Solirubrobacteraceae bacterium]|nr:SDR family oxidoreductase [Solirubrobacteraceae bacterium]
MTMDVVIVGANGQIARLLGERLVARGDEVRGVVRSAEYAEALQEAGIQPVLIDLEADSAEDDLAHASHGADALVFAAGAGPGSSSERKWTVDYQGAVHTVTAAGRVDVPRVIVISAMGTDDPPQDDSTFSVYLQAKAKADVHVRGAGVGHTIVRPGRLTDDPPTGRVQVGRHVDRGDISRADVADVLVAVLDNESAAGRTFEVVAGPARIEDAIPGLADMHDTLD